MPCIYFTLFIYLNVPPSFIDEYACNICETNFSDNILQVYLWGEQPKPNVYEVDVILILISGIPYFLIVFVFMQHLSDVHFNLSHVSLPTNFVYLELKHLEEYITS